MRMPKLRSSLLLSTAIVVAGGMLWAGPAHTQDATWSATPGSGDFNDGANWVSVPPNTVPVGTAFFDTSNITSLTFSANTTLGGWTFNTSAAAFDFTVGQDLSFDGAGIAINGGSAAITVTSLGLLRFNGSSTAGTADITNDGTLTFNALSTAGSADITNNSFFEFINDSSAGSATIANSNILNFSFTSTAGNADITNNGTLSFDDRSSAGDATITNNAGGEIQFFDTSTAGTAAAVFTNNVGASIEFNGNSTAGDAEINNDGGTISFNDSSFGGRLIRNNSGVTNFNGSSNAGVVGDTINNNAGLNFNDTSTAGGVRINNNAGGRLTFDGSSSAGNADIRHNGVSLQFRTSSTAGSAGISSGFGRLTEFFDSSSAGSATIRGFGRVLFDDTSSAGNADIFIADQLVFNDRSTAGNAALTNDGQPIRFLESSTAGSATIVNNNRLEFDLVGGPVERPSAGSATITNRNVTLFNGASTAASATITNENILRFQESSSAGRATIFNENEVTFTVDTTAGNATIINNDNSLLAFFVNSTAGQAQIVTNAGARTDFSFTTGPLGNNQLTAGSFAGTGLYFLGANALTVGGNNLSTEVSGVISDCGPAGGQVCLNPTTGGSLIKTGSGIFTLSGANFYTGPTTVNDGGLIVNGSITSDVTVNGGTLGGSGQIGGLIVNNGGTVAPGNSIGTMTVNGNFTLGAGAVYEVEANAAGQSDKVIVNGTVNLTGATLRVLAAGGAYKANTDYVIIQNDGTDAVTGEFASVTANLVFLIPTVFYAAGDGNDVVLNLERNATLFRDVARTKNQKAVAGALDRFPTDNPLFLAVLNQTGAGARQAFDALSGEIHATIAGTLSDDSRYAREAVLGRLMQANHSGEALSAGGPQVASLDSQAYALGYDGKSLVEPETAPLAFWTRAYGAWGDFDSDGNAASADRDLGGFISGMDADIGSGWRAGLATGASFSNVDVNARYSSADVETYHLGGYLGGMAGSFALRGGGLWAWSEIDTSRAVVFPGFYERQKANYDADTGQLFGEIAYPTQMGGVALEPFGGLAFVSVDTDGFTERGGPQASLRGVNLDQDVGYTSLGLRMASTMMWGATQVTPHISAAWLHAFDDVTPGASLAFATTGIGFAIDGVPLAEDSALLDAGLDFAVSDRVSAGVSYTGQFSSNVTDNGVKGRFTWLFN